MNGVTLGGRALQVIAHGPVKHDYWMAAQLTIAGVDQVMLSPGETPAAFVDALLAQLMATGQSLVLLGGMLAPAEMDLRTWTPEVAAEMTAFIGTLMEPADKELVRALVAQVLIGFFRSGLASLMTSRTASMAEMVVEGEPVLPT